MGNLSTIYRWLTHNLWIAYEYFIKSLKIVYWYLIDNCEQLSLSSYFSFQTSIFLNAVIPSANRKNNASKPKRNTKIKSPGTKRCKRSQ